MVSWRSAPPRAASIATFAVSLAARLSFRVRHAERSGRLAPQLKISSVKTPAGRLRHPAWRGLRRDDALCGHAQRASARPQSALRRGDESQLRDYHTHGGPGVAVSAPVGGPTVGPSGFQPPPAGAAAQQPCQQVPAHGRARWAARSAGILGGDVIGLADDRLVGGAGGDHPPGGQVPPLHRPVTQPRVGRVDQVGVGSLPVPHLPPGVPRVGEDRRHRAQRPRCSRAVRIPPGVGGGRARDRGVIQRPGDSGHAVPGQPLGEHPRHHRRSGRVRLQPVRSPARGRRRCPGRR